MFRIINDSGVIDVSVPANTDLSSYQYFFVKLTSGKVALCGANEEPLGILQNAPSAANQSAAVRVQGLSLLKVNEAIGFGKMITSTAGGLGEVCDADAEAYGARCMTDETYAQNDLAEVLVQFGKSNGSYA